MARNIRAAVVTVLGQPPKIISSSLESPSSSQTQVKVIAAGLHQLVRSRASGTHYSVRTDGSPIIPGVDGVGELPSGEKCYFTCFDSSISSPSFAEYANINSQDIYIIPSDATVKPEVVAALGNPTMSSFMSFKHRVPHIKPGFSVLILGVTGAAGQIAAQVSRYMGAKKVIGAGRNQKALDQLKAAGLIDSFVTLLEDATALKESFATSANDVDLVLDYLWGSSADAAMNGIYSKREKMYQRLDWVQIGNMAGPTINLSAAILRQANFYLSGSGLGSVSGEEMRTSMAEMTNLIAKGHFTYPIEVQSFEKVEEIWIQKERAESRLILTWN